MRRSLAGALAIGVVGASSALLAGPGGAQEPDFDVVEHLDASLTPAMVSAGQTVTVTSVDPCPQPPDVEEPTDELAWAFGPAGWLDPNDPTVQPGDLTDQGTAPVAEDGTWEVTFPAPATSGAYEFFAICLAANVPEGEGVEDVMEDAAEQAEQAAATLGDDHGGDDHGGSSSTTPSTEPPPSSTEPTMPPPSETAVFLYGPEAFTVQGAPAPAAPVAGQPRFSG
jgi:hypothetical protein